VSGAPSTSVDAGLDVPRAGTSLQFVKPLVVDQEVSVTLRYKRRG